MINGLLQKINSHSATIGITGLGYVGIPLAIRFIEKSIEKLDYNPKIDIEQGIPRFIDWYKNYTSI